MPVVEHPLFRRPEGNPRLWRYMPLHAFVWLLAEGSLWFSRSDLLGDPHEGAYGAFNREHRAEIYSEMPAEIRDQQLPYVYETIRLFTFINCWHVGEYESALMWDVYAGRGAGVAITSTVQGLVDALRDEPRTMHAGLVNYVDPAVEWVPEGNLFSGFLHKRRSFFPESELRVIHMEDFPKGFALEAEMGRPAGYPTRVHLDALIEEVRVAPSARDDFLSAVLAVAERFGLEAPVRRSDLDADPLY